MLKEAELLQITEKTGERMPSEKAHLDHANFELRKRILKKLGIYGEKAEEIMKAEARLLRLTSPETIERGITERALGPDMYPPWRPPASERWPQARRMLQKLEGTPTFEEALQKVLRTFLPGHRQQQLDDLEELHREVKESGEEILAGSAEKLKKQMMKDFKRVYEMHRKEQQAEKLDQLPLKFIDVLEKYNKPAQILNEYRIKHALNKTEHRKYQTAKEKLEPLLAEHVRREWRPTPTLIGEIEKEAEE